MNVNKNLEDRKFYYDYLRIFAIMAMITLHVSASNWARTDINGFDWQVFNFYDSIVRWCVPIFVMISGALFLKKEVTITKIYKKYIPRMLCAFVVWSFIYFLFAGKNMSEQLIGLFQDDNLIKLASIIKGHYHLWFIPMIAGIYMCIPIIKKITEDEKIGKYFMLLSFLFAFVLPQLINLMKDFGDKNIITLANALDKDLLNMHIEIVTGYVYYFILGYFISDIQFSKIQQIAIYLLGLLGFAFTIIISRMITIKSQAPIEQYYGNFNVNVLLETIAVFELFKNIPFKNKWYYCFVVKMSKWSFGAYLAHALIIEQLKKNGINTLSLPIPSYLSVPAICLIVFCCSFIISAILNYIPFIKKYIV